MRLDSPNVAIVTWLSRVNRAKIDPGRRTPKAADPPKQRFVDTIGKRYATLPRYDESAFQDIYDIGWLGRRADALCLELARS
jgi:hypothetical protein